MIWSYSHETLFCFFHMEFSYIVSQWIPKNQVNNEILI